MLFIRCLFLLFFSITSTILETTGLEFNYNYFQNDYHIVPHRMELIRYNKKWMKEISIRSFKYNRTTAAVNVTFTMDIDNNDAIHLIVQAYKFMSNEFRLFPLRFGANFCKGIATDMMGVGKVSDCGNFKGCPIEKGKRYSICNWTPDETKFPPGIPYGQYKVAVNLFYVSEEIAVVEAYANVVQKDYF